MRGTALAAYVAGWVLLASVYAAAFAAGTVPIGMALRTAFAMVLPNALLGLVSLRLAERPTLTVRLVPAILLLAAAATAGWLLLIMLDAWLVRTPVRMPAPGIVIFQLVTNALIHTALAGIGYARHTAAALREARELAARAEVLRSSAESQLLRSQLQPHFVNNMLHALLGLVRRDPALAESALERLGELLRFGQWVHQSGSDWVPLSREWDFVRSYLDLERVRLGDRLSVSLDADPSALEVVVPPFALQPLVENAILHGVAPRASGGRVEVSAKRAGGRLRLSVSDDGPGRSDAEIAASPRRGIRLLKERLAALYDGRASLAFERPASGGFCARLDLPDDAAPEPA